MNSLERCKVQPSKDRYATFELAEEAALKKQETYNTPQRTYLCDKPGPHGEEPCGQYHHTSEPIPLAEVSSPKFAKINWKNISPAIVLPSSSAPSAGKINRATSAVVNGRRERVRKAVLGNSRANYKDIADSLGVPLNTFMSDVVALQKNGILPYRNDSGSRVLPAVAAVESRVLPKPPMTAAQKLAELKKQMAEVEKEAEAEEAARIERERVYVEWVVGANLETLIQVRKNTTQISYPVEVWRELIPAVSAAIEKRDKDEIAFTALDNATDGTIVSGPNAGQIYPDYRRHDGE